MNCESVREHLVDLWRDALNRDRRRDIESHLAACADCARENERLELLWTELGALEDDSVQVPSQSLRGRFYPALETYQRELDRPPAWRRWLGALGGGSGTPLLRPALSLPTLILGVGLGAALMWGINARARIQELSTEVDELRRSVSLSLLTHDSASERLRGVSWGSRELTDDRIVDALLTSVRNDPNVNVRLAALEALASRVDSPRVQSGLIESLPRQQSPVLQVALAEILTRTNGTSTVALRDLLERDDLDEEVREQIRSMLESA